MRQCHVRHRVIKCKFNNWTFKNNDCYCKGLFEQKGLMPITLQHHSFLVQYGVSSSCRQMTQRLQQSLHMYCGATNFHQVLKIASSTNPHGLAIFCTLRFTLPLLPEWYLCTKMAITPLIMVRLSKFKKVLKAKDELYMPLTIFCTRDPQQNCRLVIFGSRENKQCHRMGNLNYTTSIFHP